MIDLRQINISDLQDKSLYFVITELTNNCFINNIDQCSFDQLKMSNLSYSLGNSYMPLSHKTMASVMHVQKVICRQ